MLTQNWFYGRFYQFFLFPFSPIAYTGSVFTTIAVAVERYLAVCQPARYHSAVRRNKPVWRAVRYAVPVAFLALLLNLGKFFETEVRVRPRMQSNLLYILQSPF